MKTFRLTAAAVLLVVSTAVSNAQMGRVRDSEYFPRNEVYVQYGTPSIIELTTILNSEYRSEGYDGDSRNHKFSGIAAVGYSFFVHPRVSVGLDFGYGYGSADMYITDSDAAPVTSPIFVCRSAINSYSVHVSASYTYWQQGPMECSGALYLGVSYQDESIERSNRDFRGICRAGFRLSRTGECGLVHQDLNPRVSLNHYWKSPKRRASIWSQI